MHLFLTIVAFIVVFSVLILVHELGHFMAAKRAGVKVEEFGFGLPPRLFGVKRGETLYSLNWIPFGGFVRMLGEGEESKESQSSQRSYSNKPFRVQAFIVCAGVLMNLLLSFVLLTIGFVVGIEPLIASEADFLKAIREGTVQMEPVSEDEAVVDAAAVSEAQTEQPILYVPRLVYHDEPEALFHGVLQSGDVLLSLEGQEIFSAEDLNAALELMHGGCLQADVYRPGVGSALSGTACLPFPEKAPLIAMVLAGSPAEAAGLKAGDRVLSAQGVELYSSEQLVSLTQEAQGSMRYLIQHAEGGEPEEYEIALGADGRIGISLTDLVPYYQNFSFYPDYVQEQVVGTSTVQYGWRAPVVAVQEMWRLGKMTAEMFVGVLKQFVTAQGVPEGVSGPVGIAQMTGVTLTQGWAAMLRFVALLSLSLGVINILPFPALDGGHFALITVKAIFGKRKSYRWENLINLGGFFFLLAFIFYITFNDVMNLF